MANKNPATESKDQSKACVAWRRMNFYLAVMILVLITVLVGIFWVLQKRPAGAQLPAIGGKPGLKTLQGRWVRPDGGYVLEIKEIGADGKMKVAYFNPFPINVSQAEATDDGKEIKVFIELRDRNYPGATYHLTYDPGNDQLKGVYMQPALRQSFQVIFLREK